MPFKADRWFHNASNLCDAKPSTESLWPPFNQYTGCTPFPTLYSALFNENAGDVPWRAGSVLFVVWFMTRQKAGPMMVFRQAPSGKMFQRTGCALTAVWEKPILNVSTRRQQQLRRLQKPLIKLHLPRLLLRLLRLRLRLKPNKIAHGLNGNVSYVV